MEVTVLAKQNYVYTLRQRDAGFFLSVVCGGVGMFEVEVELAADFAAECLADGKLLDRLCEKVRFSPDSFMPGQSKKPVVIASMPS
jgi:hypothetical protein